MSKRRKPASTSDSHLRKVAALANRSNPVNRPKVTRGGFTL